ncbi:hypothetical protein NC653_017041 [Populus alba x Populus x berolinensis]|uniref:MAT1 centre domain-containing protein n=1 Tax=Populus alba x Populus x berolinensis TaxID=444605 RepID=A0AAD6VZY5_9ROSI|nr:hypothetical protein NC653_017041 [Populus alba x Populus x berolinensis]
MVVSNINPHNKEIVVRRRIASIFNKREDDFPSLREYNDYLEEVEDMSLVTVFNLVAGDDVAATEEKIAEYQEENADLILVNQARKAEELALAMAASKGPPAQTDNTDGQLDWLFYDMEDGGVSSQGISVGAGQYAPTVVGGQPRPTGIAPQPVPLRGGPDMHGYLEDEETMRIRTENASRAAGWSIEFSKKRGFEEAFASFCV